MVASKERAWTLKGEIVPDDSVGENVPAISQPEGVGATPLPPTPTLAESAIFDALNKDFGDAITGVLRAMQERDIPEGKVTVSLDITAQVGAGNIEPQFDYKVSRALICKSERKGEINPDGQLVWDEKAQGYKYVKRADPQTDLFDAEETTAVEGDDEPV